MNKTFYFVYYVILVIVLSACSMRVIADKCNVYLDPYSPNASYTLTKGQEVVPEQFIKGGWVKIKKPVEGFVKRENVQWTSEKDKDRLNNSPSNDPQISDSYQSNNKLSEEINCPHTLTMEQRTYFLDSRSNLTNAIRMEYQRLVNQLYSEISQSLGRKDQDRALMKEQANVERFKAFMDVFRAAAKLDHAVEMGEQDTNKLKQQFYNDLPTNKDSYDTKLADLDYAVQKELYKTYVGKSMDASLFEGMLHFYHYKSGIGNTAEQRDMLLLLTCESWRDAFLPFCIEKQWSNDTCKKTVGEFRGIVTSPYEGLLLKAAQDVTNARRLKQQQIESLGYKAICDGANCNPALK
ncbi:MAG: hypothetical protein IT292_05575 [Deltaproteobacteria bacterium]|nr:hypothetical protein [Deltaproteobacteria bacterium]